MHYSKEVHSWHPSIDIRHLRPRSTNARWASMEIPSKYLDCSIEAMHRQKIEHRSFETLSNGQFLQDLILHGWSFGRSAISQSFPLKPYNWCFANADLRIILHWPIRSFKAIENVPECPAVEIGAPITDILSVSDEWSTIVLRFRPPALRVSHSLLPAVCCPYLTRSEEWILSTHWAGCCP